jgi:hypothetical protein
MVGIIPVAMAGGVTMKMTQAALGGRKVRGMKRRGARKVTRRGKMNKVVGMGPYLSEKGPRTLAARRAIPRGGDFKNVGL